MRIRAIIDKEDKKTYLQVRYDDMVRTYKLYPAQLQDFYQTSLMVLILSDYRLTYYEEARTLIGRAATRLVVHEANLSFWPQEDDHSFEVLL